MYKNYKFDLYTNLFGEPMNNKQPKESEAEKVKRKWENRFQRWCNEMFEEEGTSIGKCGNGGMCDYCVDNSYGRPCVRALNQMLREKHLSIDYDNTDFLQVWNGDCLIINKSKFASSETANNSTANELAKYRGVYENL